MGWSILIGCGLVQLTPFCKTPSDKDMSLLKLKALWEQL
jgi:hypothetical protein